MADKTDLHTFVLESLLTEDEAAAILSTSPNALRVKRCRRRKGPPFIKFDDGRIRYVPADLAAYIAKHRIVPGKPR